MTCGPVSVGAGRDNLWHQIHLFGCPQQLASLQPWEHLSKRYNKYQYNDDDNNNENNNNNNNNNNINLKIIIIIIYFLTGTNY